MQITKETDRIYKNVRNNVFLHEGNQSLQIIREKMDDVVVWNPWIEIAAKMSDLPDDGYQSFVCIESGQIVNPFKLSPQQSIFCSQTMVAFSDAINPKL